MTMSGDLRYPLHWPAAWPRTKTYRTRSRFARGNPTVGRALDLLAGEMSRLGVPDAWTLSSNIRLNANGWPSARDGNPVDPGVAVYFKLKRRDHVLACDRWYLAAENIIALAKHIAALRGMDRWGVGSIEQAFGGYASLPAVASVDWPIVLGVSRTASKAEIRDAFAAKALIHHPDRGGTHDGMARINEALAAALRDIDGGAIAL